MKKILAIILALIFIISLCGCSIEEDYSYENEESNTVYLYDFNGNILQTWKNVDYYYGSENEVYFYWRNGQRVEIYNAPVVIIED